MDKLIIGSTALNYHFKDFHRKSKDLDYVVRDRKLYSREEGVEYLENPVILKYQTVGYLSPKLMTSLKVSHLLWETNWDKHMYDLQFLLKKGFTWDVTLVKELRVYWEQVLPKVRRSQLEQSKEEFFTNGVNDGVEEHDYLHSLLAKIPAYTKILKDGAEVELDESKWNNLSFEEKCDVVFEETAVMNFERRPKLDYRVGYKRQLQENIQKHFPEFISFWAIENYIALERPKYNYIKTIENELQVN